MLEFSNIIDFIASFWLPWLPNNIWHSIFFFLPSDVCDFVAWVMFFITCGSVYSLLMSLFKKFLPSY